jgi:hypothetical protein
LYKFIPKYGLTGAVKCLLAYFWMAPAAGLAVVWMVILISAKSDSVLSHVGTAILIFAGISWFLAIYRLAGGARASSAHKKSNVGGM